MAFLAAADSMHAEIWVAGLVGAAAAMEDLLRRTISNWFALAALTGGLVCQVAAHGWRGAGAAVLGAAGGFSIFLVFYLFCGRGGGDVKLMAGFGAILGVSRLIPATIMTAIFGGMIAAGVLGFSALRRWIMPGAAVTPAAIPYAPAMFLGVLSTLLAGV